MITVVIDTNVLITASEDDFNDARKVIDMVCAGKMRAVASRRIEDEYHALIARATGKRARADLDEFFDCVARAAVRGRSVVMSEDREDQKFLDCAVVARADFLISNDYHLLDLGVAGTTAIVTPKEFIARMRAGEDPEGKGAWADWVRQVMGGG